MVEVKWHPRNKKHYENLGYKYTKIGDVFYVKLKDLMPRSKSYVWAICDYCGQPYRIKWQNYQNLLSPHLGNYCKKCGVKKTELVIEEKYGVKNVFQLDEIKEKIKQTCRKKYHCEYYSQSDEYKAKNVSEKIRESMMRNGTVPTSKPQLELYEKIKSIYPSCKLNYPFGPFSLDMYLKIKDVKIDIEYDGWYWHQDKERDTRRNNYMFKNGLCVFRIFSKGSLPSEDELKKYIDGFVNKKYKYKRIKLDV